MLALIYCLMALVNGRGVPVNNSRLIKIKVNVLKVKNKYIRHFVSCFILVYTPSLGISSITIKRVH